MLELKNIKKSYKAGDEMQEVLKGISINFRRNEFTSILGSSGSGKTTLLNIIGGLDKYDDGDLIIEGISTKKYTERDWDSYRNYRVGFIFQSYNLIMHQSVLSNVEMALTLSGVSKKERKAKAIEVLTKVGLKDHIDKTPNQLSGGQMQRVAIARALINDPEIILADEPTGALDSKTSVQIMDLLKEIASDKLIIMVTHNPDIAKEYSTRIIELKDGNIINDTNPYNEKEQPKTKKIKATAMSLLTSLSLSYNNLLTKKGRTFLTAIAGSIGIIGIALILSLSNGVQKYASNLEKNSLGDYPITIERENTDLMKSLTTIANTKEEKCNNNKLCSKDDVISNGSSLDALVVKKNNLKKLKEYIDSENKFEKNASDIAYDYNFNLQVYTNDYNKVNPSDLVKKENSNIFNEIKEIQLKKYKLLAGKLPENKNEVILVVDKDKHVNDSLLYSLGIKDRSILTEDLAKKNNDEKYKVQITEYNYDDILNKTYKVILNTDYYKEENGSYIDYSNNKEYMKEKIDNGIEIKIVGIVTNKDGESNVICYTHDLKMEILEKISQTSIYTKQIDNKKTNVLTNEPFDEITNTYDKLAENLAIYDIDNPSRINIYPKDYNSKENIVKLIEKYNKENKKNKREDLAVEYSDVMKSLVSGISSVINIISFVLIGFIAISLIVSSIMIGIITYISVLERTKEIGILRAIGASKKDIKRVFIAETIIEGFISGALGIIVALLLSKIINAIVLNLAKIKDIATLPFGSAVFLISLSILLNVIAGLIPASMAAKKDPVESLRTE